MANCAIVGINWGDEGKGRMVDYLTGQYDVVVRYQGGGNAGHTVINDMGKFALHLLPSGVFRPGVMNILGNGVALDCENLVTEMETIRAAGVSISPENLMVSHRASLLLPWHRELDALEEARLKDKMYGSTKQGIAPFYSDKYQKKTIQAGELLYPDRLMAHLQDLLEWKNLILQKVYGAKGYTMAEMTAWLETYAAQVRPYVADTGRYLRQAQAEGKAILFEGQLGALRDLDYGIYPYTTSSNTIAAYAPIGAGLPTAKIDEVVGVVKAYSSCVGEGPFTCEWFGADAEKLREAMGSSTMLLIDAIDDEPYVSSQMGPMLALRDQCAGGIRLAARALGTTDATVLVYRHISDSEVAIPRNIGGIPIKRVGGKYPAQCQMEEELAERYSGKGSWLLCGACAMIHLYRAAVEGRPQTTTFVTVAGNCVGFPRNVEAPLGTPVLELLKLCGLTERPTRVILGGPLTGTATEDLRNEKVELSTTAVLAIRDDKHEYSYTLSLIHI